MKRVLVVSAMFLLSCIPAYAGSFPDVSDTHPQAEAIEYVFRNGIVGGYPDGSFGPEKSINRAELAKILVQSKNPNASGGGCFPDVQQEWFAPYICTAKSLNILGGYPDGSFKPAQHVTFVEAAKMLSGTFGYATQQDPIWYKPFVEALSVRRAIPLSVSSFDKKLTRGEVAQLIYRLHGEVENKASQNYASLDQQDPSRTYPAQSVPTMDASLVVGAYETNQGVVTLALEGGQLAGSFERQDGKFSGTLQGRTLTATWVQAPSYQGPNDKGSMIMYFSKSGERVRIVWKAESASTWRQGWSGTKMSPEDAAEYLAEGQKTPVTPQDEQGSTTTLNNGVLDGDVEREPLLEGALTEVREGITYMEKSTRIGVLEDTDDGMEHLLTGEVTLSSQKLGTANGTYLIALRFQGVNIPRGAIIKTAFLEFRTGAKNTNPAKLSFRGEATDNASVLLAEEKNLTTRKKTSAKAVSDPAPLFPDDDTLKFSANLAPVLQEIFDRPGWKREQSFVLFVEGTGDRLFHSSENGSAVKMNLRYLVPVQH